MDEDEDEGGVVVDDIGEKKGGWEDMIKFKLWFFMEKFDGNL